MDAKNRSRAQEELLSLYLRLNGFFVTGFIVHSPVHGQVKTEIDVLAVRFPYNCEPERQVDPDPNIETSDQLVDLVICEAKSKGQQLQFNDKLLKDTSRIVSLLRWAGLHQESEIQVLAPQICSKLSPTDPPGREIPTVPGPRKTRVRGLLCSPERDKRRDDQAWFLPGSAMLSYISTCLCGYQPTCSKTYDLHQWGPYEKAVRYFKERGSGNHGTMKDFYAHLQQAL